MSKIPAQWQFESQGFKGVNDEIDKALTSGIDLDADTPETRAISTKFFQLGTDAPLNDLVVATTVEKALPKEVVEIGSQRLRELLDRRSQIIVQKDNDIEQQAEHNAGLLDARAVSVPPLSAQGGPLPRGEKLTEVAPNAAGKAGGDMPAATAITPGAGAVGRDQAQAQAAQTQADAQASKIAADLKAAADAAAALEEAKKAQAEAMAAGAGVGPAGGGADDKGAVVNPKTVKRAAERVEAAKIAAEKANAEVAASKSPPATKGPNPGKTHSGAGHVDAGVRESASRPIPKVEAVRLTQAPPLDDWDKHVDATCKKFGFSDAQVIKAQSILKDLRQRAEAYRKSRDDEFAAADRLSDAKAKTDRKAELAKPIDALFEELKQRLDNLATAEQRAKATASNGDGTKKK